MTDRITRISSAAASSLPGRWWLFLMALLGVLLVILSLFELPSRESSPPAADSLADGAAQWSDEGQCQNCHQAQVQDWRGSHHRQAMLPATESSVRGDFDGASLHTDRETSHFFRKGDEYWVRSPDAHGTVGEFRIAYTFGWEPLQQYLIAMEDGRLQALGAAWDTEREQWFHLYEGQGVDANHPLHWTRPAHTANTQCIDCHTTGFETNYQVSSDSFDSQWQSLGVTCQACHGPAAAHLEWAQSPTPDDSLRGFAQPLRRDRQQLETCARCHSRRTPLGEAGQAQTLEDGYLPSPLSAELYEVDGKILDEVFEHGSFLQSHMQRAGVVCSDCHNPHSGQLRAQGNAVCSQCHNPAGQAIRPGIDSSGLKAANYDSPAHHHHPQGSAAAACRNCHMPGRFYMGNDLRHDHSFSSPNPAQALALGHSDACLSCHEDQPADALLASFDEWFPDHQARDGGYARALHAAREGQPGAAQALLTQLARGDLPAPRRAALLAELPNYPSPASSQAIGEALRHDAPSVRRAALAAAGALLEPAALQGQLGAALGDTVRSVRLSASEHLLTLVEQYGATLPADVLQEYEQVQSELLANAEAHFNLARLYQLTGRSDKVEASLRAALQRNPAFSPASIALAQWLDASAPGAGLQVLEERLQNEPDDPDLQHALGLARIRAGRMAAGVEALEQARSLAPDNDTYAYVLAVAWYDTGRPERALDLLRMQLQRHPASRFLRLTLLGYLPPGAEREALLDELKQQNPQDPALSHTEG